MIYKRIDNANDPDIPYLSKILKLPEISRFLSIDEHNYWTYVAKTENVFYFKVLKLLWHLDPYLPAVDLCIWL